jgi:predicted porin
MGVGPATINIAQMKSATIDGSSASVELGMGDITIGYEQNKNEAGATETEGTIMGAKYTMGATTLAYELMQHKTDSTKDKESTQIQASYTVTPGVTAVVSSSDLSGTGHNSGTAEEITEIQLKVSF